VTVQVVLEDEEGLIEVGLYFVGLPVGLPVGSVVVVTAVEQGGGTNVGVGESGQAA
jgi:hypothetical protein